jgi:hypothetical protein
MNSFYSILRIPVRPAGNEVINIGLLLAGEHISYFRFSARKLEVIKKLLPENSFDLLRSYLFGLNEKIIAETDFTQSKFTSLTAINYLSNYNNNLITFSNPTPIDLPVDDKTYRLLFEKFVYPFEEEALAAQPATRIRIQQQLKTVLYPQIRHRVNVNQTVTPKELPTLLVPGIRVNFIGHNENPVAGQGVDFEKMTAQITNTVSRLISLIKAFELHGMKHGKYYVVGQEPARNKFREQHDTWSHIRASDLIEFVDIQDAGLIHEYLDKHQVKPFVETE